MKRIHILQHAFYETPGCIEDWLKKKSYTYSITHLYEGETLPAVSDIDWLIIMGGPMSVHDTEMFPWLIDEKRFIREAVNSGKIVIGICLGAQLIAEALGSRIYQNDFKEIGWFPVTRVNPGSGSGIMHKFENTETVFHWHGETFEMPHGAVREFSSEACRTQCFTYGEKVLALQFHLEVTENLLNGMIASGNEELLPGDYIQSAARMLEGSGYIKRNNELLFSILDKFDNG